MNTNSIIISPRLQDALYRNLLLLGWGMDDACAAVPVLSVWFALVDVGEA
jgi:hypothetical protein